MYVIQWLTQLTPDKKTNYMLKKTETTGNNVAWDSLIQKIKCKRLIEGHTKFGSVFF